MNELKKLLFDRFDGFADKRKKNITKGNRFIVDNRRPSDCDARGRLFLWFCTLFVDVVGPREIELQAHNLPWSTEIDGWTAACDKVSGSENTRTLIVRLSTDDLSRLETLASLLEAIVAPGAEWYPEPSFKYVCPRTATSLRRLAAVLKEHGEA